MARLPLFETSPQAEVPVAEGQDRLVETDLFWVGPSDLDDPRIGAVFGRGELLDDPHGPAMVKMFAVRSRTST